jgi:5-methylcytosine-specific restriction enzyme A
MSGAYILGTIYSPNWSRARRVQFYGKARCAEAIGLFCFMPTSAPRGCKHHGCKRLVQSGQRYCDEHRPAHAWADRRESASERGYGWRWQQTRKRILRRDVGLCQVCKAAGRLRPASAVDHVVPKEEGGADDDENLQAICTDCHTAKTGREAARGRGRSKV